MFNSYAERWTTYRLGPRYGVPYEGSRFDYSKYDQFMKQHVPRWTTSNAMVQAAYDTYFASMTEGMIVMAHSQGGLFSLEAALKNVENVRGVILVESSSDMDVEKVDVSSLEKFHSFSYMGISWEKSTALTGISGLAPLPGKGV